MYATRLIAFGSPHGDDQAGWHVAWWLGSLTRLESKLTIRVATTCWELVEHAAADSHLILVDACRTGAAPGTLHQWALDELPKAAVVTTSSHGGSLLEVIALARQLGRLPLDTQLLAIEIASTLPGEELTTAVATGVEQAVQRIVDLVSD